MPRFRTRGYPKDYAPPLPDNTPKSIIRYVPDADTKDYIHLHGTKETSVLTRTVGGSLEGLPNASGELVVSDSDVKVYIAKYEKVKTALHPATSKLLDYAVHKLGKTNGHSVRFKVAEYAEACGLRSMKDAREAIQKDMQAIYNVSLDFQGKDDAFHRSRVCTDVNYSRGTATFGFNPNFAEAIKRFPPMLFNSSLWLLNNWRAPHGYLLGRKLIEHVHMNAGKANARHISVPALLRACPGIPTYEDVMAVSKKVRQLIIQPFEKTMNALTVPDQAVNQNKTVLNYWRYQHQDGRDVSEAERSSITYNSFITWRIAFELKGYQESHGSSVTQDEKEGVQVHQLRFEGTE